VCQLSPACASAVSLGARALLVMVVAPVTILQQQLQYGHCVLTQDLCCACCCRVAGIHVMGASKSLQPSSAAIQCWCFFLKDVCAAVRVGLSLGTMPSACAVCAVIVVHVTAVPKQGLAIQCLCAGAGFSWPGCSAVSCCYQQ
jgi:hypothetical protein